MSQGGEGSSRIAAKILKLNHLVLAVRVGFEPTEPAKVQRFSRPPDSTALAPHRIFILPDFPITCGKCHQPAFCFKTGSVTILAPFLAINPTARLFASQFVWA